MDSIQFVDFGVTPSTIDQRRRFHTLTVGSRPLKSGLSGVGLPQILPHTKKTACKSAC